MVSQSSSSSPVGCDDGCCCITNLPLLLLFRGWLEDDGSMEDDVGRDLDASLSSCVSWLSSLLLLLLIFHARVSNPSFWVSLSWLTMFPRRGTTLDLVVIDSLVVWLVLLLMTLEVSAAAVKFLAQSEIPSFIFLALRRPRENPKRALAVLFVSESRART